MARPRPFVYPDRYQLPALTAHVVSLLERRRLGVTTWSPAAQADLVDEAKRAMAEAGRQFAEVADDPSYWAHVTEAVLEVVVPRWLKLAGEQHALEQQKYGIWRGGDLLARAAYGAMGLVGAVIVWRTAIPDFLEPLPLLMLVGGPLLPDLWAWRARRRYQKSLQRLVDDMAHEQAARQAYRPLSDVGAAPVDPVADEDGSKREQPLKER